ncbi:TetR/AcrR family transcriptional regulator [Actinomadura rubrisoli]|uniref:TetR/AcrR family transcriptional regulator n=1 Tax=Actinomadura rubrisoli TaxID=2530368 RepID=UPI001A9EA7E5|nr:TetR/AcrR family transcriptional regulator [Actinomadura rubrisoli]
MVRNPEAARKALMKVALDLFERKGFAGTSVQSVVDGANLTKGAFYHHFASKEHLLLELHDTFIDDQLERARRIVSLEDLPVDQMLRRLVTEALLQPMSIYKSEITVFIQERRYMTGEIFEDVQRKRDRFEHYFVEVIERGMREGVFREVGPPLLVAFGLIGMGAWTYVWLDAGGSLSPTEIGDMYADMLINGLVAPDGTEPRKTARKRVATS